MYVFLVFYKFKWFFSNSVIFNFLFYYLLLILVICFLDVIKVFVENKLDIVLGVLLF